MRQRQFRLLPLVELRTNLFTNLASRELAFAADFPQSVTAWQDVGLEKPDELSWWDWTVFLLHTAAEVEHSLMVQYLYAAYSLDSNFSGAQVPPNARQLVNRWRRAIIETAQEEMAHLLTVQNLLRLIGGPLNFDREDFPFLTFLYPFRLQLEPLSKTVLAKYIAAEMPAETGLPADFLSEIIRRATQSADGSAVNRVGIVYEKIIEIFRDASKLRDEDLHTDTLADWQAKSEDWMGSDTLLVREVGSREAAVNALVAIAEQGEGTTSSGSESHFEKFVQIYREFPETDPTAAPLTWLPTRPVPVNPNTLHRESDDEREERGRVTDPTARLWATLFNVRYRKLLLNLNHVLHLPGAMQTGGQPTIKGLLRDWSFVEMRGIAQAGLKGLAKKLVGLPLKINVPPEQACAAPTFELPYTLVLPDREQSRWRLHQSLLQTSRELIEKIEQSSGNDPILDEIKAFDDESLLIIQAQQ